MKKKTEKIKFLVCTLAVMLCIPVSGASAMHIMEGYLPVGWSAAWGFLCLPFLVMGGLSLKKQMSGSSKTKILLAMSGAFVFVLSSLKIPSVVGSCSHPTGTGLGAVLFGPAVMSILGIIVLLFQAILLAHGGLSTLGANTFSMAVAGPFVSYGVFVLLKRTKCPKSVGVFLAAAIGDLFTYCVTSAQLAAAFPGDNVMTSLATFMGIFALTQIPIAIAEGILSVIVYNVLEKYCVKELVALGV